MEPLEGIGAADEVLGRPFPLPTVSLPLARWVEVQRVGDAVEVEWNLDDSRPGSPGRLALLAGREDPPTQLPEQVAEQHGPVSFRTAPLPEAQSSLRPVVELTWERDGLHLRLTAQGPWEREQLLMLVASIE